MVSRLLKVGIGVAALLLAWTGPDGEAALPDYQLSLRAAISIAAIYLAFDEFQKKRLPSGVTSLALCWLVEPFSRVHQVRLPAYTWRQIDVAIAIVFGLWAAMPAKTAKPLSPGARSGAILIFSLSRLAGNLGLFVLHFWAAWAVWSWKGFFFALLSLLSPPIGIICVAVRDAYHSWFLNLSTWYLTPFLEVLIATLAALLVTFAAGAFLVANEAAPDAE